MFVSRVISLWFLYNILVNLCYLTSKIFPTVLIFSVSNQNMTSDVCEYLKKKEIYSYGGPLFSEP